MRIEGMVSGVAKDITNLTEKVVDLKTEVIDHRAQLGRLQSDMQQVKSDQATAAKDLSAADKAREDTATALEKQTAEQVRKAKDAVDSSNQRWTPMSRLYTTIGAVAASAATVYYLTHPHG
jgi:predicted  nucleic acid-binding Zn-ribbon protein